MPKSLLQVCLVGAESTGKTTLAQKLAEHFHTVWVPEYGRIFAEGKQYLPNYSQWESWEFLKIAIAQIELVIQLSPRAKKYLFMDTDAFATCIWHRRYMGDNSPEIEKLANKNLSDLYFVTAPDVEFVQDGTRDGERIRQWMHEEFIKELEKMNRPYFVISGPYEQRFNQAISCLSKF